MSRKVAVAAMSTSGLDYYPHPHNIALLRLKLILGGVTYSDDPKRFSNEQFVRWVKENELLLPKTSPPNRLEITKFFLNLADQGYEEVIFIAISSKLSKSYQNVLDCIPLLKDKIKIHPFDSKSGTFTEGWLALEAERLLAQGWDVKKVLTRLEVVRNNSYVFFGVDDLTYLVKNGRLSSASQFLANVLRIKPLIRVEKDGTAVVAERVFTTSRAMQALCHRVKELTSTGKYSVFTLYAGSAELHREMQIMLSEQNGLRNLPAYPITPAIASHVGPYSFGVGIVPL
ncbi:DegV family protein [Alysiella filiformis]|uniref:EDD domain protein, DegV family n=1 Tax=Alysiella filiformis DSM 16848 TaxID=1120981 RepID=A0A286EEB4_9NEIS|nr:DegV family protein [Alysiella filiformis]QMT30937.1 DegV family protein [Alysiella filiformis]UBQ56075.1 DegV family protein [Alysiella filiformis DSM 16848]SOD69174.1 EDD domain protein, DegV family [Alysiella filiformis DSM 16848]